MILRNNIRPVILRQTQFSLDSPRQPMAKKANCFVFIDLETHDLFRPKITEICMIAVTREHIINAHKNLDFSAPRVLNKLSICVSPEVTIHPQAAVMTALSNELLKEYAPFNRDTATMLTTFIELLPKPVCLVAHNGFKFDFPVLKIALQKVSQDMPDHLLCGDTLPGFKAIFKTWSGASNHVQNGAAVHNVSNIIETPSRPAGESVVEAAPLNTTGAPNEISTELLNDGNDEILAKVNLELIQAEADAYDLCSQITTLSDTDFDLRQSCSQLSWERPCRNTPKRKRAVHVNGNGTSDTIYIDAEADSVINEEAPGEPGGPFTSTPVRVRKDLFPFREPPTYRLGDVYEKLRGSKPLGHQAEVDVVSMMECVLVVGPEMLEHFDENCILFKDVHTPAKMMY